MKFNVLDNTTAQWLLQEGPEFIETLRATALAGGSEGENEGRFELGLSVDEAGFTVKDYRAAQRAMETQFLHGNLSILEAKAMVELHKKVCTALGTHERARSMLVGMIRENPSYNELVLLD